MGSDLNDRTRGRDPSLAGAETSVKRAANAAREQAAGANLDYEENKAELEA